MRFRTSIKLVDSGYTYFCEVEANTPENAARIRYNLLASEARKTVTEIQVIPVETFTYTIRQEVVFERKELVN